MHDMNTSWQQMPKEEKSSNSILKWLAMGCLVQEMVSLAHPILIDSSTWMNWYVTNGNGKEWELLNIIAWIGSRCTQSTCVGSPLRLSNHPRHGKRPFSRFIKSSPSIEYSQQHCQHFSPRQRWKYRALLTNSQPFPQREEWWFTTRGYCTWSLSHW